MPCPPHRYTRPAIVLHWLLAALIVGNVLIAWSVDALPDAWVRPCIDVHKSIGITALGLVLLRLLWRAGHPPPASPQAHAPWEKWLARAAHLGLYLLMLGLPITGWMHDSAWKDAASHPLRLFWVIPFPRIESIGSVEPVARELLHKRYGSWHEALATLLYGLFALHLLGALKHQFRDGEQPLQRMWF